MSTITGATPGFFCTTGQRDLQADDIDGALALYGGSGQSLVTFAFTGVVTAVIDPTNILGGSVAIQAPVIGTFSYDTNASATPVNSYYTQYQFLPGPSNITVTVSTSLGPKTVSTSGNTNLVGVDYHVPSLGGDDIFGESGTGSSLDWQLPFLNEKSIGISLVGTPTFLTGLGLPQTLDLTQTQDNSATSTGASEIQAGVYPTIYVIEFRLTSLTRQ